MRNFNDINLKLCHYCGTCVGVCPTIAISMTDNLPSLTGKCIDCGLCYDACPGIEFSYPEFNKRIFDAADVDNEIGFYRSICIGHATNDAVRKRGASGGVITALLLGLIERKEIFGAIVVGMNKGCPWVPQVKIATSKDEILNAAQSKYSMVSVNEILKGLNAIDGDLAFVGLPCHMHGLRKLEKIGWKDSERIKYRIGIFCGFNMESEATNFLIQKLKVRKEEIESLEYRGGDWPGGFLLKTKDGHSYFIEKHIYNYLNLIYVPRRCLVCPDLTNEFADIAAGDAWNKDLDPKGWSTIIVRTKRGQELIELAAKMRDIEIKLSDKNRLKEGHSHLILYKKKGIFIRQKLTKMNPHFELPTPIMNMKEKVFNTIFFFMIVFMKAKFIIKFLKYIPLTLPGLLGKYIRSAINFIFRPKRACVPAKKSANLFHKIIMEYKYLTIRQWNFSDVGAHWDNMDDYDDINKETYSYFRRFVDGYRLSNLPKNSNVLDLCARTGNGTLFFWERGVVGRALCADFSKRMQSMCAERLKKAGVPFRQELIESVPLPFKEREFDAILCFETVEHVPMPDIFIRELARVVKHEGQLVLSTPNLLWRPIHLLAAIFNLHHSEGPCRFISRNRLRKYLREAGFNIITEKTTVLIPAGPKFLIKFGEYLEERIGKGLMDILGLRQVYICRKR